MSSHAGSPSLVAAIPVAALLVLVAFVVGTAAGTDGAWSCGSETKAVAGTLKMFVPIHQAAAA
jgi:hypothetical protein